MAICPKCKRDYGKNVMRTRHHCLPKRWFRGTRDTVHICRTCHDDLEAVILAEEQGRQLRWMRYYELVNEFVGYRLLEMN